MPSRDPAKPDATGDAAAQVALTLAEAEAKAAEAQAQAAEAKAEAARARAELLKLQHDGAQSDIAVVESDSAEPAAAADETADQPGGLRRVVKRLRRVAAAVTVFAIGGLIAADVLMLVHHRGVEARQRQLAEYAAAARQGVVTLMSLDYKTVDDDVKRIIDNTTGEFKKDFEDHADEFIKMAHESKAVTEATATLSAVESMSDTEAVVLVAASTKVTNTAGAKEEPRNWRLAVHLTREGDQIKMSKVDFAT